MIYSQKLGIPIKAQLISGYPGEDETTVQETIDLFRRAEHPGRRFNLIMPLSGSKIYNDTIRMGLIKDEPAYLAALEKSFGVGRVHVNFTKWPDREIYLRKNEAEQIMIENYYNRNLMRKTGRFVKKARAFLGKKKRSLIG
jgi:radical SAM superfamily enzyme YgiQ (UPF0313 family)